MVRRTLIDIDGCLISTVLDPAAVLRREELRATMLEDLIAISQISEGATKDINTEPGDLSPEVPQTAQLSSVDYLSHPDDRGHVSVSTAVSETTTLSAEEASRHRQLALVKF